MEPSNRLTDVIVLGKKIEKELGIEDEVDTLGRWMIHYVAELIDRAEKASGADLEEIRRDCADIIIKLWAHRASLPMKRYPLESFDEVMGALIRLRDERPYYFRGINQEEKPQVSSDVQKWLKIAEEVDHVACELVDVSIEKAIACAAENEKEWLNELLALSLKTDKHAEMVSLMISRYKGEKIDLEEHERIRKDKLQNRLRAFGEHCLKLAENTN